MKKNMMLVGVIAIIFLINVTALLMANPMAIPSAGAPNTRENYGWWARSYGLKNNDSAYAISDTSDGGYIAAGYINSTTDSGYDNGHVEIIKLNSDGTVEWEKTYAGDGDEAAYYVQEVNGSYIVSGTTSSFGSSYTDIWILKLAQDGTVIWEKRYGGQYGENGYKILPTSDGGFIIGGDTLSYGAGNGDLWLIKINDTGSIEWQKVYGGPSYDYFKNLIITSDGGYLLMGITQSFGAGGFDIWLIKLDSSGNVAWQKVYGGTAYDYGKRIIETADGYMILGHTNTPGNFDLWVLKIDTNGNLVWQKTYGGDGTELSYDMAAVGNGYILMGFTTSWGAGGYDVWLVAINNTGAIEWQRAYGSTQKEIGFSLLAIQNDGLVVAGETESFGSGYTDIWVLKTNTTGYIEFNLEPSAKMTNTSGTISSFNPSTSDTSASVKDTTAEEHITTATVKNSQLNIATQSEPVTVPELGYIIIIVAALALVMQRAIKS